MDLVTLHDNQNRLAVTLDHRDDPERSSRNYRIKVNFSTMMQAEHDYRWSEAMAYAQSYLEGVKTNWNLPNGTVFESIAPDKKPNPAIEMAISLPEYLPDIPGINTTMFTESNLNDFMRKSFTDVHNQTLANLPEPGRAERRTGGRSGRVLA